MERRVTELPVFTGSTTSTGRGPIPLGRSPNDGVFANLSAKPESGEKIEDQPPVGCFCPFFSLCQYFQHFYLLARILSAILFALSLGYRYK
jgi:hypothetical protein